MKNHRGLRERNGKWAWRYQLDGREYSETTDLDAVASNVSEALALMVEHRRAIREGRDLRPLAARKFSDAWAEFLCWAELEHAAHPRTAKRLRDSGRSLLAHFGALMVAHVQPADVERYKAWRSGEHRVRDITLRHDLHALSKFFRWAERMGYGRSNPVASVKIPSGADAVRMHVLTADEERRYFAAAAKLRSSLHDLARLMILQGCRPDELMRLRWSDVDLDAGTLRIERGKSRAARRTIHLCVESRSLLAAGLASSPIPATAIGRDWVFPGRKAGHRLGSVQHAHERALALSGGAWVLYDLRHTFASRAAALGMPITTLAAILGHSSLACVTRYVHPSAEDQRREMARFDAMATEKATTIGRRPM